MRYKVAKTDVIDPNIDSKEWEKAEVGRIEKNRWDVSGDIPETIFKVLRGPEGISVYMHTKEEKLRAEITEENGRVCEDSCMEFFFKPDPLDTRYMNFEFNPKGVLYLGLGDTNKSGTLDTDRKIFSIETIPNDGDWKLKFYVPDKFILEYYKRIAPICKANFYKCGDLTENEHYGMWNEVEVDIPNFHVTDFFGILEL